jgi:hypothetical protein
VYYSFSRIIRIRPSCSSCGGVTALGSWRRLKSPFSGKTQLSVNPVIDVVRSDPSVRSDPKPRDGTGSDAESRAGNIFKPELHQHRLQKTSVHP